jgi:UDP-3-O-[3-hydroxymyristoyl] glucosamine N-acyltransferase
MPTVAEVLGFLGAEKLTTHRPEQGDPRYSLELVGVNTDQAAGEGELAWVSPKVLKREPQRLQSFRGSVLIHQAQDSTVEHPTAVLVPSETPKLAFIRAVTKFFPSLGATRWPQSGEDVVSKDSRIAGDVRLAAGVVIGSGVSIGPGCAVGPGTCLSNCEIGPNVTIGANCSIGLSGFGYERDGSGRYWRFPHVGKVVIESDVEIGSNTCIDRGAIGETRIGRGSKIDNLVHIAHNVTLAPNSVVIANAMLAGSVRIGEGAWVAPSASIMNQAEIGARAIVGLGAVVLKSVAPDATVVGNPAKPLVRDPTK